MKLVNVNTWEGGPKTEVLALEEFAGRRLSWNNLADVLAYMLAKLTEKGILSDAEFLAVLGVSPDHLEDVEIVDAP